MKLKATTVLILSILSGCSTMERHPKMTRVIVGSLVLTGVMYRAKSLGWKHDVGVPEVKCDGGACK